ncbi:MAG: O-acetyl-ADP-ribose deacetylase [Rhodothermales bacterium]
MDAFEVAGITIRLVRGDITNEQVDAIVNAANSSLMGGGGVDGAIHKKGGPDILEECKVIRSELYPDGLPTGEAISTTAGAMPAKRVIHTVGPVWNGGEENESNLLANAYRNSLMQARHESLRSIAFPSISTGVYGYPINEASKIALKTVAAYISNHKENFDEVRFVLFSDKDLEIYRTSINEYLTDLKG